MMQRTVFHRNYLVALVKKSKPQQRLFPVDSHTSSDAGTCGVAAVLQLLQVHLGKQLPQQQLFATDRARYLKRQQFARSTPFGRKMLTAEVHV
jgi:hypothetical protein